METKKEVGGIATSIIKWSTALGGVAAIFGFIVGPVNNYSAEQRANAELELKRAEIDLERLKAKQGYVLAAFGESFKTEEELALLNFMANEYDDDATKAWIEVQSVRLQAIIAKEKAVEEQQFRETTEKYQAEASEKARGSGQGNVPEDELLEQLTPEQIISIESQKRAIQSKEMQLQSANQLIQLTSSADTSPERCEEKYLGAVIFKPFSRDRILSDYDGDERAGIIAKCLDTQPSSTLEWKAVYQASGDTIGKRITCSCPSQFQRATIEERSGFQNLVNGDYDAAIAAFTAADRIYPEFHQVHEIGQLLTERRGELDEMAGRLEVFETIIKEMSWKAPSDLLDRMKHEVEASG